VQVVLEAKRQRVLGDPLVEPQFGVEVSVLAVAEADVLAGQDLDEELDVLRVELCARDPLQLWIASNEEIGLRYESRAVMTSYVSATEIIRESAGMSGPFSPRG